MRLSPPSITHFFGTNNQGQDLFTQVIYGSRLALIIGGFSAFFTSFIGMNIGLVSGYYGGRIDEILMRITDIFLCIPFLPFALILVSLLGPSNWNVILVISLFLWRPTARVIRSQVLTIKQRPFILAAKAAGASDLRIMYRHITPNVLPLVYLYLAFGVAWGVMTEASLSFLGFGDPSTISWGMMLYTAFKSGAIREAWWWVIPPGVAISMLVVSSFLVTRAYEEVLNPRLSKW
jgi:peptide/nickel transport system permease protein